MQQFLCHLLGGPNDYKGPDMISLHKNMKIKKDHFEVTWAHMDAAFLYYGTEHSLMKEIREAVFTQMGFIVNTPS